MRNYEHFPRDEKISMELKRNIDHNRVKPLDDECKSKDHRLTKGCTSLMYACQQGNTGTIVTELRNKVIFEA